jgi:hypothetical protein
MADEGIASKHRLTQNPPTKETRTAAAESSHHASPHHAGQPERLGSGDGEVGTMNTRQTASEPLPASVLFALGLSCGSVMTQL